MYTFESYINTSLEIEKELLDIFSRDDSLVVFDIGACEGEDSIRYANLFVKANIYAFEPRPDNIEKIKTNLINYNKSNIIIIPEALSKQEGIAEFYLSSGSPEQSDYNKDWDFGNKSSSLLPPGTEMKKHHDWLKFEDRIEVQTNTLKNFCQNHLIKEIDFIHLDVQGAELMVLEGASELIHNIKVIWMEVEAVSLYKNQPLKPAIEKFMRSKGFIKIKDTVNNVAGDQLYINSKYFSQSTIKQLTKTKNNNNLSIKINNKFKQILNLQEPPLPGKPYQKISYSQAGEDLIVRYIFNELSIQHPSYIDIGAHHPYYFNNTALFYENGSRGINIEPDPALFKNIAEQRRNDINLNIGIAEKPATLNFYRISKPELNTFSQKEAERYKEEGDFTIVGVDAIPVDTVKNVLDTYNNGKFPQFLTLDAEGIDETVLQSIDYHHNFPIVICVETISFSMSGNGIKNKSIIKFLEEKGYLLYADTWINSIFVKKDMFVRSKPNA